METQQLFERRIHGIRRVLKFALGVVVLVAIGACFVRIDEKYKAFGKVVPRDEAAIYAPEDCSLRTLLVKSGDRVTSGQLTMLLSTDDLDAEKMKLTNDAERLDAEIAAQQAEKEKVLKNPLSPEFRHVDIEVGTAQARVKHYEDYLKTLEQLAKEGIVSKLEYSQAKLAQIQAQADLKRDEVDQHVLEKGYAEAVIRGAQAQVRLLETMRRAVDRQRTNLEERYARRRVVAPAAGLVVACEKRDLGEPVKKGEVLYRLALSDAVIVRLMGPERNINRVSVGQTVLMESLVFSAYKYGYARGDVLRVAKDAEQAQALQNGDSGPLYRITCSVTRMPKGQTLPLGSSVTAKILLRRGNLFFVLMGWGWPRE